MRKESLDKQGFLCYNAFEIKRLKGNIKKRNGKEKCY